MKILVSGGQRFDDYKLVDRAMDALHRKKRIRFLITGGLKGAQEMAYYWAVRSRIAAILTVPMQPDLTGALDWSRWNRDILKRFEVDGLVLFPGRSETDHLAQLAEDMGRMVWRVPRDWRC